MNRKEEQLQTAICTYMKLQYPNVIFKVDSVAQKRGYAAQGVLRKQQYKPGFPDFMILHPVGKWHGLLLELKKDYTEIHYKNGTLKPGPDDHFYNQQSFMTELTQQGYAAQFCWSFDMAKVVIDQYLKGLLVEPYLAFKSKASIIEQYDKIADEFFGSFNL